ncbi:MAG: dTDP-4-dehydrorhamnose reductase [Candidatus Moranbacteria bacterium]|nr:dTDP-4-dehydrorhamnose reductase [Candidatus Moranbacteria bacterium]
MENKKTKVIIIGAKGMLGRALADVFAGENYETLLWDREQIDISNGEMVAELIEKEKPDLVINTAAHNAVDKIEEDDATFELAKKINGEGPLNLALACNQGGAVLAHFVSDYVFDGEKGEYVETDLPHPISRYGETKLMGEENVAKNCEKYYLIRTSKLFGPPAISKGAKKSFFETMLELAKKDISLKVVDAEISCFAYSKDLAEAVKKLWEEKFPFGIYHLVNEGPETWYTGLKKVFAIVGITDVEIVPVSSDTFPRPAKRPASAILKNTKFPQLRDWEAAAREWMGK